MSLTKARTSQLVKDGNAVSAYGTEIVALTRGDRDGNLHGQVTGAQFAEDVEPNVFKDLNAVSSVGLPVTVWTPTSGTKIRLTGGDVSVSAASSLLFEDNAGGSTIKYRTPVIPANQPYVFEIAGQAMLLSAINNVLKVTAASGVTITGTLWGVEE